MSLMLEGRDNMCVKSCLPAFLIGKQWEAHRGCITFYRFSIGNSTNNRTDETDIEIESAIATNLLL